MGTRATVMFKGKIVAFTHWDGYPNSLGQELESLHNNLQDSLVDYGKGKNFKMKKEFILGVCIMHQVDGTKTSDDFQEWEYDVRNDGVYARRIGNGKIWIKLPPSYDFTLYNIDLFVESNGQIKKYQSEKKTWQQRERKVIQDTKKSIIDEAEGLMKIMGQTKPDSDISKTQGWKILRETAVEERNVE